MKPKRKSYDSKCLDLAEHFLSDCKPEHRDRASDLAQHIQEQVEDWLNDEGIT